MNNLSRSDAIMWASGEILTSQFPDDWEEMKYDKLYEFITDHAIERDEFYEASSQWCRIEALSDSVLKLIGRLI